MADPLEAEDVPLLYNEVHWKKTADRWTIQFNRPPYLGEDDRPDEYDNQCGICRYYVPLQGLFSADFGACTNEQSACDGRVMFEHDGCEHHVWANEWVTGFVHMRQKAT